MALAVAAFAAGLLTATGPARAERALVTSYVTAWRHADFATMYGLLDSRSRARVTLASFRAAYASAAATATLVSFRSGRVSQPRGNLITVPLRVRTRIFGTFTAMLAVPFTGSGSGAHVQFDSELLFPGVRAGEQLTRQVSLPPRATLYARDGTVLAQGPALSSPIPEVALQIAGTLGPIPAGERATFAAEGYPPKAMVGSDGLELVFQQQLAGTPGGTLFAGRRVLAVSTPQPGAPVTTTIEPKLEDAEIAAMANRYAGMVAMNPQNGEVLAVAGIAYSDPQPPGSTMKIITATAALQAKIVKLGTTFPIATSASILGYSLQNANGEACGGTLLNAFAVSCNSVFAPLGVELGAARFVAMAEKFGFNGPPAFPGQGLSTLPSAATIGDALAVGSSAIGQGQVLATPLEMAIAGAAIAMGGKRPVPTFLLNQAPTFYRVTTRHVAALVQKMMIAVVQIGTGTAAAIPGVVVAGKTGTAELTNTTTTSSNGGNSSAASNPQNTDAWFVGYVPVGKPRIVVAALFPGQGAGGATAAPAVQQVLAAALGR
ncbi:MAG TPA: penicillin-binding transpeptidase domain-containing protein [Solirubrobacteraceae bacterium]|nr:penicillin-binding transpeptidase domain-containing protein [Solirubrobacteraceae bacterium]